MKDQTKEVLNALAEACSETAGGSFSISRRKDKTWVIYFPNSGKLGNMTGKDITSLATEAREAVLTKRTLIEVETRYTLYS